MKHRAEKVREILRQYFGDYHDTAYEKAISEILVLFSEPMSEERYRIALQYIVDHKWVIGKDGDKWIKEFVDVADTALTK